MAAAGVISRTGALALMVAHCAGMVDLVALPLWIGTLVQRYGFDEQQAGGTVTLFLLGAVAASIVVATRVGVTARRRVAVGGFLLSAAAFGAMAAGVPAAVLVAVHVVAGLSTGAALSVTHGSIGQSANPHRMFAAAGIALGVFAIAFMAGAAPLVSRADGLSLFTVFGAIMATAALACALAFPRLDAPAQAGRGARPPIARAAWFAVAGISTMALIQAMVFGFLERAGHARGFAAGAITGLFVAIGAVNLLPAAIAALLQHRVRAQAVLLAGPAVQAALAATIMNSSGLPPFAAAASVFAAVMIFTHTFAFGLIGRLDRGGRALSATPAMLMTGAAIGPVLGGTLVKFSGYPSIGLAACVLAGVAIACYSRIGAHPESAAPELHP